MKFPDKTIGLDGKLRPARRVDTTERDKLILKLRMQGMSVRVIAGKAGCSVGTVQRIINKER